MTEAPHLRSVEFWVPGKPFGKQDTETVTRVRYKDKVTGEYKYRELKWPIHHTPTETRRAMKDIAARAAAAMQVMGIGPFSGPVACIITAVFSQPESWSEKRKRESAWHVSKPDGPNVLELVADSGSKPQKRGLARMSPEDLHGILWEDDAQLVVAAVRKVYGSREGLLVTVSELDPGSADMVGVAGQGLEWRMDRRVAAMIGASAQLGLAAGG